MNTILALYKKVEVAVAKVNRLENCYFYARHRKSVALKKILANNDKALLDQLRESFDGACKTELKARQAYNRALSRMRDRKEDYALAVSPIKCNQIVDLPVICNGCSKALIVEVHYTDWGKDPLNVFYFNAMPINQEGDLLEQHLEFSDIEPEKLFAANGKIVTEFYASPIGQEVIELHRSLKQ